MLRRKLLKLLGPLVALLLVMAVVAIILLQGVLQDLEHINDQAWRVEEQVSQLSTDIGTIEVKLFELKVGREHHLDALVDTIEGARERISRIGQSYVVEDGEAREHFKQLQASWPDFERHIAVLATVQDQTIAKAHNDAALNLALSLRQHTLPLSREVHEHAHLEQESLIRRMRWLVLGLAIVFLLVINAAVLLLMRAAGIILEPVDKLVHASRELAAERFACRVNLHQTDEFGELASAYNHLAEQLQANEQRRLETLGHVATTLNHELNNAMSIIELQLQLLSRRAGEGENAERCLRRIHEGLERMTGTLESLKHIKRIVLTDYVEGTKMLDLIKSTEDAVEATAETAPRPTVVVTVQRSASKQEVGQR